MPKNKISLKKIKETILEMTELRGIEKSICPSEVARAIDAQEWRELMPLVREQAIILRDQGKILITQKNKILDNEIHGAIRLKKSLP